MPFRPSGPFRSTLVVGILGVGGEANGAVWGNAGTVKAIDAPTRALAVTMAEAVSVLKVKEIRGLPQEGARRGIVGRPRATHGPATVQGNDVVVAEESVVDTRTDRTAVGD